MPTLAPPKKCVDIVLVHCWIHWLVWRLKAVAAWVIPLLPCTVTPIDPAIERSM